MNEVRMRPATEKDRELVYVWANDPLTRAMSFRQDPITRDQHVLWFEKALMEKGVTLLIAERLVDGHWVPCGNVRFDGEGEIHVLVAPEHRHQGLAALLISAALRYAGDRLSLDRVTAHIKEENDASIRAFEKAGFLFVRKTAVRDEPCLEYACVVQKKS